MTNDAPVEKVLMVEPGTGTIRSIRAEDVKAWRANGYTLARGEELEQPEPATESAPEPETESAQPRVQYPRRTSRRTAG